MCKFMTTQRRPHSAFGAPPLLRRAVLESARVGQIRRMWKHHKQDQAGELEKQYFFYKRLAGGLAEQ